MIEKQQRLTSPEVEIASAVAAVVLGALAAVLILAFGALHLRGDNGVALFDSTLLGPGLALAGAWLDAKRGQSIGLIVLGLAALLALDGVFATYFLELPAFALVVVSFVAGIRRKREAGG